MGIEKTEFSLEAGTSATDSWDNFIEWEQKSRDVLIVKKEYIDIVGDLNTGILLDQIIYWHLPSKRSKTRLRVSKDGEYWLAKKRHDWWDEIRLSEKQYDRSVNILKEANIVETKVFKFGGVPVVHIKLNKEILLGLLSKKEDKKEEKPNEEDEAENGNSPMGKNGIGYSPMGKMEITQTGKSIEHRLQTKTTNIESKDSNIILQKQNSKKEYSIDFQENNAELSPKQNDSIGCLNTQPQYKPIIKASMSTTIREKSLAHQKVPRKAVKGKPHKILKANEPYWEIMRNSKFKPPQRPSCGIFKNVDAVITKLREGTFFKDYPDLEHMVGRKITTEDFQRFFDNFTLAAFSPIHLPTNISIKNSYQKWYLTWMVYNTTTQRSAFASYLDTPPKKIQSAQSMKDPNPNYTDYIIKQCNKVFGWDLGNGDRATAIKCATRLPTFYETNKHKILLYDIHYKFINQQVDSQAVFFV